MGWSKVLGALLAICAFLVLFVGGGAQGSSDWGPWGEPVVKTENRGSADIISSLPVDPDLAERAKPPKEEFSASGLVRELTDDFNQRYGWELDYPEVIEAKENKGEYSQGRIYVPIKSEYAITHEMCHYFQDKTCRFEAHGESFCEVFAEADRRAEDCEENGWPYYYCTPIRLSEVNRKEFIDCVFDGCEKKISREELMECYEKNKK